MSTATCLNELLHRIVLLKANNYKVLLLSVDISNAYSCGKLNLLYNLLVGLGINPGYCDWIYNFLSERTLKMGMTEVKVRDGLPQGICLSPILFILYTASLHTVEDDTT